MKHGEAPAAEPLPGDPWIANVNADMTAFLLLEEATEGPEGTDMSEPRTIAEPE